MLLLRVVKDLKNLEEKLFREDIVLYHHYEESFNYFKILRNQNSLILPQIKIDESFPVLYEKYSIFSIYPNKTDSIEYLKELRYNLKQINQDISYREQTFQNKTILYFFEKKKKKISHLIWNFTKF